MKLSHFSTISSRRWGTFLWQVLLVVLVFFSRIAGLPANISPLGSYGFFGRSVLFFAASIIAFDYFVGGLYQGMLWTYAGFALYPLLGWLSRKSIRWQLVALPLASFGFFLLSNFGVFLAWYEHSWQGFLTCYALALPFYTRTLVGDLLFGYGYLAYQSYQARSQRRQISALI